MAEGVQNLAARIRLLALDVDGVLTDGRLLYDDVGEAKTFHVRDGHGIKSVLADGVQVAIISGRDSRAVDRRMAEPGVQHVFQGCRDKVSVLQDLLDRLDILPAEVAFVGDDTPDLAAMGMVGLAVADAHPSLPPASHWLTGTRGGFGAVREVCDLILEARRAAQQ